ncbi:MAG: hypothetical protein AUJ74_03925 [Candidatus Omnitrophica bacterium CG1_02_44_16]|nr:MAG: hypothetical protein AUJ74_03925 [Candidatus Omnitrophica bacterium CG1_02_44_16]PIY82743.1 MAG: hypothetical protein COY78_04995 [Candidatus Omnitrophica bacterium CG_4_10_14_0_8_um_filter_44_12]PIZ84990.1 MAG: hypothetical protein COX96_01085 [Candidatus Omnitrophica bacterium CG_4_10_14_0_2_um_filter_44_9]
MIREVKVTTKAFGNMVKEEGGRLKAYVTAAPEKGKANKVLVVLLSAYFKVKKKDIRIIRGEHAQIKTVLINID